MGGPTTRRSRRSAIGLSDRSARAGHSLVVHLVPAGPPGSPRLPGRRSAGSFGLARGRGTPRTPHCDPTGSNALPGLPGFGGVGEALRSALHRGPVAPPSARRGRLLREPWTPHPFAPASGSLISRDAGGGSPNPRPAHCAATHRSRPEMRAGSRRLRAPSRSEDHPGTGPWNSRRAAGYAAFSALPSPFLTLPAKFFSPARAGHYDSFRIVRWQVPDAPRQFPRNGLSRRAVAHRAPHGGPSRRVG
jgi:hypothetical protein